VRWYEARNWPSAFDSSSALALISPSLRCSTTLWKVHFFQRLFLEASSLSHQSQPCNCYRASCILPMTRIKSMRNVHRTNKLLCLGHLEAVFGCAQPIPRFLLWFLVWSLRGYLWESLYILGSSSMSYLLRLNKLWKGRASGKS
jgi:hypothetical protein